ncbi:MAG: antibiotic biosynthesis monooxygenase [Dehalococcoidia bacterium]|nr:antibiotic biosynthesis monooxygenase [Dehalococcoidia bacterium]
MAIKVIMLRHVLPGREQELNELLLELRIRALRRPGYVSGQTLILTSDPSIHLVIGEWSSLEAWRDWEYHPERLEMIERINTLLTSPTRTEVWWDGGGAMPSVA